MNNAYKLAPTGPSPNAFLHDNKYPFMLFMMEKGIINTGKPLSPREELEARIQRMEHLLGVRITVHDIQGALGGHYDDSLIPGRNLHRHPYCWLGRKTQPGWEKRCVSHCAYNILDQLVEKRPITTHCWKGVQEVVVPILRDDEIVLVMFAGAFKAPPTSEHPQQHSAQQRHSDLPPLDDNRVTELKQSLELLGDGLLQLKERLFPYNSEDHGGERRSVVIETFFRQHAHRPIRLPDLADVLSLSPSRTSHLVKELFNRSFQDLLMEERIRRARFMLKSTSLSLEAIAHRIGMPTPYYLSRHFKRMVGMPPGQYRKQVRNGRP